MNKLALVIGTSLMTVFSLTAASAEEAKTPINALTLIKVMSISSESRDDAYNRALKDEKTPPPRSAFVQEADGSIRYEDGRTGVSVTVKNPCPPGTAHYEPPPLPGRRSRN